MKNKYYGENNFIDTFEYSIRWKVAAGKIQFFKGKEFLRYWVIRFPQGKFENSMKQHLYYIIKDVPS